MHTAANAVIAKHFGPDDQRFQSWSPSKRRAYAGLYRYYALTFVLRQNNWQAAGEWLRRALQIDPTLAVDLDLFYDLALGAQPVGYRGAAEGLNLGENARHLIRLLAGIFGSPDMSEVKSLRRTTFGTAHAALGLVAYNTDHLSVSRRHLAQALYFRPDLRHDARVIGDLIKSCLGRPLLNALRRVH
jgi:hypothetical protein